MTSDNKFCLKVTRKGDYFHAVCQGEVTLAGVLKGWTKLAERCFEEGIAKIVCQPQVSGSLEFIDVYQFGISFRDIPWPPGMRVAVVCKHEDLTIFKLAETMVSNLRGPESRIFTTLQDARAWLRA